MFILRTIFIGTFNNFVNIRGASPKLEQRQKNLYKFPDQRKRTKCLEFFFKGTEKYASFKSSLYM